MHPYATYRPEALVGCQLQARQDMNNNSQAAGSSLVANMFHAPCCSLLGHGCFVCARCQIIKPVSNPKGFIAWSSSPSLECCSWVWRRPAQTLVEERDTQGAISLSTTRSGPLIYGCKIPQTGRGTSRKDDRAPLYSLIRRSREPRLSSFQCTSPPWLLRDLIRPSFLHCTHTHTHTTMPNLLSRPELNMIVSVMATIRFQQGEQISCLAPPRSRLPAPLTGSHPTTSRHPFNITSQACVRALAVTCIPDRRPKASSSINWRINSIAALCCATLALITPTTPSRGLRRALLKFAAFSKVVAGCTALAVRCIG
jgi:hypothetical protein